MAIEIGPQHPVTYRQEVVTPFFQSIYAGDSCVVIGPSSMGKSRLLQFIRRADVQQHYLGEQAEATLFVWVDQNRLAEATEWGFYELLLTSLVEVTDNEPQLVEVNRRLASLWQEVIYSEKNDLFARRQVERAVRQLCLDQQWYLCFLLDEFDKPYATLPTEALSNLRAIRDIYKYQISYAMFIRDRPERLRDVADVEGFYELFSSSVIGLKPYGYEDGMRIIAQVTERMQQTVSPKVSEHIYHISGGHPGLIVALIKLSRRYNGQAPKNWTIAEPRLEEECRKLWQGLAEDEQVSLVQLGQQMPVGAEVKDLLRLKGVLCADEDGNDRFFSPLFQAYVNDKGNLASRAINVDQARRVVWVGSHPVKDLTAREFDLITFLYDNVDTVCGREEILQHLYPKDSYYDAKDNRVDNIVRHVRKKIEPVPKHPTYLVTVRQKGYKLVQDPSAA